MGNRAYLEGVAKGTVPAPPISKLLGFRLVEAGDGRAVFELTPGEHLYNPIGVVHGGVAATLLDSAMGCAVHTKLPDRGAYTTLDIHTHLVRAIHASTGVLRCEGEVVHMGRSMATAQARLVDAAGKLYAHGSSTCLILPGPGQS